MVLAISLRLGELKRKKDGMSAGFTEMVSAISNNREEQVGTEHAKKVTDISEHNGRINDWKKVIDENEVDGVIVRLGYMVKKTSKLRTTQGVKPSGNSLCLSLPMLKMRLMLRMTLNRPLNL